MKIRRLVILFGILGILLCNYTSSAYAANGTIEVNPKNGSYQNGEIITSTIIINGGGENFNAAEASVAVSSNLSVQNLVLGDCDFAFVKTPSIQSLSFAGVILGGNTSSCTLYTVTLKPLMGESGYIFISDASIKSYNGAQELLKNVINSSYTFNTAGQATANSVVVPTESPAMTNGLNYYTVVYNFSKDKTDENPAYEVILDPEKTERIVVIPSPIPVSPNVLSAVFPNVVEGVHTIAVEKDGQELKKDIINVEGTNKQITLGVDASDQRSFMWYLFAVIPIIIIITIVVFAVIVIKRKIQN